MVHIAAIVSAVQLVMARITLVSNAVRLAVVHNPLILKVVLLAMVRRAIVLDALHPDMTHALCRDSIDGQRLGGRVRLRQRVGRRVGSGRSQAGFR
jgi:hypothetical protein